MPRIEPTPPPDPNRKPNRATPIKPDFGQDGTKFFAFGIAVSGAEPLKLEVKELRYSGDPEVPFLFSGTINERIVLEDHRSDTLMDAQTLANNPQLFQPVDGLINEIISAYQREPERSDKRKKLEGFAVRTRSLLDEAQNLY